jgi:hypothetical protein
MGRKATVVSIMILGIALIPACSGCSTTSPAGKSGSSPSYSVLLALKNTRVSPPYFPGSIAGSYTALDADLLLQFECSGRQTITGKVSEWKTAGTKLVWSGTYAINGDTIMASTRSNPHSKPVTLVFKTLGNDGLRETDPSNNGRLFWHSQTDLDES